MLLLRPLLLLLAALVPPRCLNAPDQPALVRDLVVLGLVTVGATPLARSVRLTHCGRWSGPPP